MTMKDLLLSEVERRRANPDRWLYDMELGWLDKTDVRAMAAFQAKCSERARERAIDEAALKSYTAEVARLAAQAGLSPVAYTDRELAKQAAYKLGLKVWSEHNRAATEAEAESKLALFSREYKATPQTLTLEYKASGGDVNYIGGYLACFGNKDRSGDVIVPGAFDNSLAEIRRHPYSAKSLLPLLYAHDSAQPVGGFVELRTDSKGLAFRAFVNTQTALGRDVYSNVKMGVLAGMSIGYITERASHDRDGNRLLLQIKLLEGSVVAIPANPLATINEPLF